MNVQEIIAEIPKLPLTEQVAVLEAVTSNLRNQFTPSTDVAAATERLLASLQPAPAPPVDWSWKQDKENHLAEKYLR